MKGFVATLVRSAASVATSGMSDKVLDIVQGAGLSQQAKDEIAKAKADRAGELQELEEKTAAAQVDASARAIEAVNATMQAESKSEHWAQWLWRPILGFTFAAIILNNYVLLPYFVNRGIKPMDIPQFVFVSLMLVCGVSAGTRGLEKIVNAKAAADGE